MHREHEKHKSASAELVIVFDHSYFCESRCILCPGWYVDWLFVWIWRGPSGGFDILTGMNQDEPCMHE